MLREFVLVQDMTKCHELLPGHPVPIEGRAPELFRSRHTDPLLFGDDRLGKVQELFLHPGLRWPIVGGLFGLPFGGGGFGGGGHFLRAGFSELDPGFLFGV